MGASPSNLSVNPGFCELAWRERQANQRPRGGMLRKQYTKPCRDCGLVCGTSLPASYTEGWKQYVDPSLNFRWESHIAVTPTEHEELLGCWICWEYQGTWVTPMLEDDWYAHMRNHFRNDGYRACTGRRGAMQRRRNCEVASCQKIHS
jgi:hypothetical protein